MGMPVTTSGGLARPEFYGWGRATGSPACERCRNGWITCSRCSTGAALKDWTLRVMPADLAAADRPGLVLDWLNKRGALPANR